MLGMTMWRLARRSISGFIGKFETEAYNKPVYTKINCRILAGMVPEYIGILQTHRKVLYPVSNKMSAKDEV